MQNIEEADSIEKLKNFGSRYGLVLLFAVILAIGIIVGQHFWQDNKNKKNEEASSKYSMMQQALVKNDLVEVKDLAKVIMSNYSNSPYSIHAALLLAKLSLDSNDLIMAKHNLGWVLEKHKQDPLAGIARMRLARVLSYEGSYAEAKNLLETSDKKGIFAVEYTQLQGDISYAQGEYDEALKHYNKALQLLDNGSVRSEQQDNEKFWLKMKISNIPVIDNKG